MRAVADALISVVLAPACAVCDLPLERALDSAVCARCWASIRPLRPPLCAVCGDPLTSWRTVLPDERCGACAGVITAVKMGRSVGDYDRALGAILQAFKYGGRRSLAAELSALMRLHGRAVLDGADGVVPVPLHWRRHWMRGFNQAADLAAGLGLPVLHLLRRCRATSTQTHLSADARLANVRGAFTVRRPIPPLTLVLIDDVRTTGATIEGCARVMREAGAREVRSLTAARVVTRRSGARPP